MIENETVKYWIDIAKEDLSVAKILFNANKLLYAGFMCHQCTEKGIKAIISRDCINDEIPPKIHNLIRLTEKALIFHRLTEKQKSLLSDLNPLNIEARYPDYKNNIASILTKEYCENLIRDTEEFLCWIEQQL